MTSSVDPWLSLSREGEDMGIPPQQNRSCYNVAMVQHLVEERQGQEQEEEEEEEKDRGKEGPRLVARNKRVCVNGHMTSLRSNTPHIDVDPRLQCKKKSIELGELWSQLDKFKEKRREVDLHVLRYRLWNEKDEELAILSEAVALFEGEANDDDKRQEIFKEEAEDDQRTIESLMY
jgi:hypothetical protein